MAQSYAQISILANGTSASVPSPVNPPQNPRTACKGWTADAARRNDRFLQSIRFNELTGQPWALTLTIPSADSGRGELPEPREYHSMLRAMIERLRRMGAIRWHWVIEMTSRKTPHVHASVWFGTADSSRSLKIQSAWLAIAEKHGLKCSVIAQCVKPMTSSGWAQYTSKHGARGVKHYQRLLSSLPDSWAEPGRMWGYGGDWLTADARRPERKSVSRANFWKYRRLVRSWCISNARKTRNERLRRKYITQARRMLKCSNSKLSPVKPVNVWIPETITRQFLAMLETSEYIPLESRIEAVQRAEIMADWKRYLK